MFQEFLIFGIISDAIPLLFIFSIPFLFRKFGVSKSWFLRHKRWFLIALLSMFAMLFLFAGFTTLLYTAYSSPQYYLLRETMLAGALLGFYKLLFLVLGIIVLYFLIDAMEIENTDYIPLAFIMILAGLDFFLYISIQGLFEDLYTDVAWIIRYRYPRAKYLGDILLELVTLIVLISVVLWIVAISIYYSETGHRRRRRRHDVREGLFELTAKRISVLIGAILGLLIFGATYFWIPDEFLVIFDPLTILKIALWIIFTAVYCAGMVTFFRMARIPKKRFAPLLLISILIFSVFVVTSYYQVNYRLSGAKSIHKNLVEIETNLSKIPIDIHNLRLIDRALAVDFAKSFKLPTPPKPYNLRILSNYAHIGYIEGKPAWVMPIRYEQRFLNKETNVLAGFIWIYLTDTPVPENIKYVFEEMTVGPSLNSRRNIEQFVLGIAPQYSIGEYYIMYPDPIYHNWSWIVLLDKFEDGYYQTDRILILRSETQYKFLSIERAKELRIPQLYSSKMLVSIVKLWGRYLRQENIDPLAQGFLWYPKSPDVLRLLGDSFYQRPHHFLIGDRWFGRDFYAEVTTAEGGESVVLLTMINDTIKFFDLRSYEKGGLRGVNDPIKIMSMMNVRYPKLYKLEMENTTLLLWIGLKVSRRIGADVFEGIAFIDAANTRIKGVIKYSFGESREVFLNRSIELIIKTYEAFIYQNETIGGETKTGVIPNGTIIRKGWILEDGQFALTFLVQNYSEMLTILAIEQYMISKENFYLASTLQPGDIVFMELRYNPERQVWLLYYVEILQLNSTSTQSP